MNSELRIQTVKVFPLDVPLLAPFTIASATLDFVKNIAVEIRLENGAVGFGEGAILPPVTKEDQPLALHVAGTQVAYLVGVDAGKWRSIARELTERLPFYDSVRAAFEMALIDALAQSWNAPLFEWFGGTNTCLVTDITIPICSSIEARSLAEKYRREGFDTLKTKIGRDMEKDLERLIAIQSGHPRCRLVLDANEGYSVDQALDVVRELKQSGIEIALFEQPVAREDWEGMGKLTRESGVCIAADESCRTPADALRIVKQGLSHVLNIKLVKCGVVQALEIAAIAHAGGLKLMMGEMVETRLGTGFSAHFSAGMGGFEWIDLDTPLLLATDPITGGYSRAGAVYSLDSRTPGQGGRPIFAEPMHP